MKNIKWSYFQKRLSMNKRLELFNQFDLGVDKWATQTNMCHAIFWTPAYQALHTAEHHITSTLYAYRDAPVLSDNYGYSAFSCIGTLGQCNSLI